MPICDRAAQFSPFAALTGYDAAVSEAARVTENEVELTDEARAELDRVQHLLADIIDTEPSVTVTYFIPDERKQGGRYRTVHSRLTRIDADSHTISLASGETVPMSAVTRLIPDVLVDIFEE